MAQVKTVRLDIFNRLPRVIHGNQEKTETYPQD
jgi:hypothetical protein